MFFSFAFVFSKCQQKKGLKGRCLWTARHWGSKVGAIFLLYLLFHSQCQGLQKGRSLVFAWLLIAGTVLKGDLACFGGRILWKGFWRNDVDIFVLILFDLLNRRFC